MRRYLFQLLPGARSASEVLAKSGGEVREADGFVQVTADESFDRALPGSGDGWLLVESGPVAEGESGFEIPEDSAPLQAKRAMVSLESTRIKADKALEVKP